MPPAATIDLNCDMGESFGAWETGADPAVMPAITSANIACGFHAGDHQVMRRTVELAQEYGVGIGAHPSYPDLQGFGRRAMDIPHHELTDLVLVQIGALYAIAKSAGATLVHVKAHGALYNRAAEDRQAADAIARAVRDFDPGLILVGLAGSALVDAGIEYELSVAREAFADRTYNLNGTLQARTVMGAVKTDIDQIVAQALMIAQQRQVIASDGSTIAVDADTICLHGDSHEAAERARLIRAALHKAGVTVAPLTTVLQHRH